MFFLAGTVGQDRSDFILTEFRLDHNLLADFSTARTARELGRGLGWQAFSCVGIGNYITNAVDMLDICWDKASNEKLAEHDQINQVHLPGVKTGSSRMPRTVGVSN